MPNAAPEAPRGKPRFIPFSELRTKWSFWIAAFWSAVGMFVTVGGAFLATSWDWRLGALIWLMGTTFGIARWAKQPGTEE
jgi:hypothetical protein